MHYTSQLVSLKSIPILIPLVVLMFRIFPMPWIAGVIASVPSLALGWIMTPNQVAGSTTILIILSAIENWTCPLVWLSTSSPETVTMPRMVRRCFAGLDWLQWVKYLLVNVSNYLINFHKFFLKLRVFSLN